MSEWLKEHAWKVCIHFYVSRVRIPFSPKFLNIDIFYYKKFIKNMM